MTTEENELREQLQTLKGAIRNVIHDVSSPLGVLRMTAYYLQHGAPDREKQDHYFTVIGETVERIASGLTVLRDLSDGPFPDPPGSAGKENPRGDRSL
jgi:nitrogen-specific signal transduction histidine kinase